MAFVEAVQTVTADIDFKSQDFFRKMKDRLAGGGFRGRREVLREKKKTWACLSADDQELENKRG